MSQTDAVDDLVGECLERAEDAGDAGVEEVLARHPEHASEVRRRLAALADAGLLARPAVDVSPGESLGEFRLLRKLGEGGMGVVYLAERSSGSRVALKLVRPGHLLFDDARERFRREAEAVSRLRHPGIAHVHEVGEESGVPYFAMELIEGCSLADVLRSVAGADPATLTGRSLADAIARSAPDAAARVPDAASGWLFEGSWTDACLRVVQQAAEALDHAHQRGVVHRDVKPSNLMITPSGRVCLLDFGLARTEGADRMTRSGAQLGSLPYLAPEQVRGEVRAIGPRTDVYGLGVTLYELLSLRLPYEEASAEATVAKILDGRPRSIRERNPAVPRDAETVCFTAMERDAHRRYASAADLARDLANGLARRPLEARRPDPVLRARRWARAHPAWTVGLVLGTLVAIGGPWIVAANERRARVEIEASMRRSEGLRLTAVAGRVVSSDPTLALLLAIEGAKLHPGPVSNRALLAALSASREVRSLVEHSGRVEAVRFSPDGKILATAGADATARLWDAETGAPLAELLGHERLVTSVRFSPDGSHLLTASEDGTARLWDVATRRPLRTLAGHTAGVNAAVFDPSGTYALTASDDRTARVWSLETGAAIAALEGHRGSVGDVAWSSDGKWIATASADATARLWSASSFAAVATLQHAKQVNGVRFDPTGRRVVTASKDGTARVWAVPDGAAVSVYRGHGDEAVYPASFDPSGARVVSTGNDRKVHVWDPSTGREIFATGSYPSTTREASWSADGRMLAVPCDERVVRVLNAEDGRELATLETRAQPLRHAEFSPDGTRVATDGSIARLFRAPEPWRQLAMENEAAKRIWGALSADGSRVAESRADGLVVVFDARSGRKLRTFAGGPSVAYRCALSADGRHVAVAHFDGVVRVWDVDSGELAAELRGHRGEARTVAFAPDGTLYSGGADRTARRWDWRRGECVRSFEDHGEAVSSVQPSPDGRILATGSRDAIVRLFDAESGELLAKLTGHRGHLIHLAFSPDGSHLASTAIGPTVRVWDVGARRLLHRLPGYVSAVYGLAFSPDGRIATGDADGVVRVFDLVSGAEVARDEPQEGIVYALQWAPDGTAWLASGIDGRVLRVPADPLAEALRCKPRDLTANEHIEHEVGNVAVWTAARAAVTSVRKKGARVAEHVAALRADTSLAEDVRAAAIEFASTFRDHPRGLASDAFAIVRREKRAPAEDELARERAELAVQAVPDCGDYRRIAALAQFRLGRFAETLAHLEIAEAKGAPAFPGERALALALASSALERSGRGDEAKRRADELDELLAKQPKLATPLVREIRRPAK